MIFRLPDKLLELDKERTMDIMMQSVIFERMIQNKKFEFRSIRTWANMPRNKHLIKEYKQFKKDYLQKNEQIKMVAHG